MDSSIINLNNADHLIADISAVSKIGVPWHVLPTSGVVKTLEIMIFEIFQPVFIWLQDADLRFYVTAVLR